MYELIQCFTLKMAPRASSQSVALLQQRATTLKLTGTDRRTDAQDHVLSQADALTKNEQYQNDVLLFVGLPFTRDYIEQ